MEKGNTSRYLKYAIGEILLVVIGILIALQINNWNENRKERNREITYLKNLKADLETELKNNEQFATYRFEKAQTSSDLLHAEPPSTGEAIQEYTDRYERVFVWNTYVPNNNTFKELVSSGNLSLIRNEQIKNALMELDKRYVEIATGEEHMRREYEAYLYDPHVTHATALGFFDLTKPNYGFPDRLSIEDLSDEQQRQLIDDAHWQHHDPVFKNGLRLAFLNNGFIAGMHKELIAIIQDLIALIETDIATG